MHCDIDEKALSFTHANVIKISPTGYPFPESLGTVSIRISDCSIQMRSMIVTKQTIRLSVQKVPAFQVTTSYHSADWCENKRQNFLFLSLVTTEHSTLGQKSLIRCSTVVQTACC